MFDHLACLGTDFLHWPIRVPQIKPDVKTRTSELIKIFWKNKSKDCNLIGSQACFLEKRRWDFFVLHIFDGVIMDGHPIFWVVDAGIASIHHDYKKSHLLFSFLVRIVLFLHLICEIYLSKILFIFIGFIWIITPFMKINVSIQETKFIAWCSSHV